MPNPLSSGVIHDCVLTYAGNLCSLYTSCTPFLCTVPEGVHSKKPEHVSFSF